ncbi:holo-ACP synthase [Pseudonocardia sp. TRM90224]|uniref:holo-ACP synthase n=1 Tax=Pseudonocardia sp. TRM90224 TaxID=2812678 RepID=UPI001E3E426B|nr:holo-ACP synthase [Pseudonocardia sp. TRM90224]
MTGLLVGTDLMRVGELERLLRRAWFRRYVYSTDELRRADGMDGTRAAEFLTGRFAAKEAVLKVLGTGMLAGVPPREIHVGRLGSGAPHVVLDGAASTAAEELGLTGISVSITHKHGQVFAVAIGQCARDPSA